MKEIDIKEEKLNKALLKRALGYNSKEVIEEYVNGDNGVVLSKKKVTTKPVPPDTTALKILLDFSGGELSEMTDEQLLEEKERLLAELFQQSIKEEKSCKKTKNKLTSQKSDGKKKSLKKCKKTSNAEENSV